MCPDVTSLDVVHSKSLGGAELKGEVLDAQQRVLTTVSYRYFDPAITAESYGGVGPVLTRTRSCGRSHLRNASCTAAASSAM